MTDTLRQALQEASRALTELDPLGAKHDAKMIDEALRLLANPPSHWEENPDYPVADWRLEVQNDDTRLGYLEWVEHRKESDAE